MLKHYFYILMLIGISFSQPLWADNAVNNSSNKQSFYKWIDGKGVTHYSATPPSPKEVAKKIKKVDTYVPAKKTVAETTPTITPQTEQPKAFTKITTKKRPDLNAEQPCRAAQKNLQTLKNKLRVYQEREDGAYHFLTDKEMEEQTKTTQQFLNDNC